MVQLQTITSVGSHNQLTAEDRTSYERILLEALWPNLIFADYGLKRSLPAHGGRTLNFRRYERIAPPSTLVTLTEGITPAAKNLTVTPINVVPDQYGDVVYITDRLQLQGIDNNIAEATQVLGKLGGETFDLVVRNIVVASGGVQYQGGKVALNALDNTCKITVAGLQRAARTLKNSFNGPEERWDGYFIAIASPSTCYDLQRDPDWIEHKKIGFPEAIMKGEIGAIGKVRIVESTNYYVNAGAGASTQVAGIDTTGGAADVHYTPILAKKAYGVIDVAGQGTRPRVYVKDASEGGTFDPLEQRSSVGYKGMLGAVELDSNRMLVVRHTVSS